MTVKRKGKPTWDNLPFDEPHIPTNVMDAILVFGNDNKYEPKIKNWYEATDALPGSPQKVEVLAQRAAAGLPLWHPGDRTDWSGFKPQLFSKDDITKGEEI